MNDAQIQQLRNIIELEGWKLIQEMLKEPMEDVVVGGFEEIALNVLAKNKAASHINFILNKINNLKAVPKRESESFK